jgi:hypothetical protein
MYIHMQVGDYVLAILEKDTKGCRLRGVSAVCVCVYAYVHMSISALCVCMYAQVHMLKSAVWMCARAGVCTYVD